MYEYALQEIYVKEVQNRLRELESNRQAEENTKKSTFVSFNKRFKK